MLQDLFFMSLEWYMLEIERIQITRMNIYTSVQGHLDHEIAKEKKELSQRKCAQSSLWKMSFGDLINRRASERGGHNESGAKFVDFSEQRNLRFRFRFIGT